MFNRPYRRCLPLLLICAVLLLLGVHAVYAADPAPKTRTGFSDTLLLSKSLLPGSVQSFWRYPTDLEWTPDNRLLITQQGGRLWVYTGSTPTLALDLNSRVCANRERGLDGVAVDPQFTDNGYIYLYYTRKIDPACPDTSTGASSGFPINRVSRFVFNRASNTVDPASEIVLVDNIKNYAGIHNAGYLHIAADGYLYISVGDGGRPPAQANDDSPSVRDDSLRGKILRVNRATGEGAPDNPYGADPQAVRCGDPLQDRNNQGAPCREVFAKGLRNPFRLAFKPNSSEFWINDVGSNTWEEIDVGAKGANYGWDRREGPCAYGAACLPGSGAPPAGPAPNEPVFFYLHTAESGSYADADPQFRGCSGITGAVFVPPGAWPAEYDNDYLFGDYVCGRIFQLQPNASGRYQATTFVEGLDISSIVAMAWGPGPNNGQSLYYSTFNGGGQLHRIDYTGSANRAPSARLAANKTYGPAPLTVQFDASGSSDPDGEALTYLWDFGIAGATRQTSTPKTSFTYSQNGPYTVRLTVRDSRGGVSSATSLLVAVGDEPPEAAIVAPAANMRFRVGEQITLRATASDNSGEPVELSWKVFQHHAEHEHPWDQGEGEQITITAPAPEDLEAAMTSYLRVELTATDAQGIARVVERIIPPHKVDVTLASQPEGATVLTNQTSMALPRTLVSWEGYQLIVQAQSQRIGERWLTPTRWADGATPSRSITTPAAPVTYTLLLQPGNRVNIPNVSR